MQCYGIVNILCKSKVHKFSNSPISDLESLTMNPQKIFEYNDESQAERIARKSKDSPFMIVGILGLIGVCGYGAYKFKSRGKMSTSVFLMQLRVAAQGTVVAALTVGICYSLSQRLLFKADKKD